MLERIRKSYSFSETDLKHEITLAKNLFRKAAKLPISLEHVFHSQLLKKLRFIFTGCCNPSRHQRFMLEKFFKNEISENISQKFHRLGSIELLSIERARAEEIDIDDIVEFDSRHDNRRIKLH